MSIRTELLQIKGNAELLMPEHVVEWAGRHPDSALHKAIEWDDKTAAREHRLQQVRRLIAVHIVTEEGHREMVSLSVDRTNTGGYRAVNDVLPERALRDIMLADAVRDLERVQAKYNRLTELAEVWNAKEAVKRRVKRKTTRHVEERRQGRSSSA